MKKYIISKKEYDEVVEAMNTLTSENQKLHGFIEGMREQLILSGVVGRSEQLKAFVEWWHGLSQEELVWYEGRYVEVFLSL